MQVDEVQEQPSPLFSFPTALKDNLPPPAAVAPDPFAIGNAVSATIPTGSNGPSMFFSLLTAKPKDALVAPDAARTDADTSLSQTDPFSEPSPDDLILKAREGTKLATRQ